ncbi:MAG: hypothetical protein ABR562_07645, partial [Thermoplasmatota archaeon]
MRRALPLFAFLLLASPFVAAQAPSTAFLYEAHVDAPMGTVDLVPSGAGGQVTFNITVHDDSHDSSNAVPGAPPQQLLPHQVQVSAKAADPDLAEGWTPLVQQPSFVLYAGQSASVMIQVSATPFAVSPYYKLLVNVTLTATTDQSRLYRETVVGLFFSGAPGIDVQAVYPLFGNGALAPRQIGTAQLQVVNRAPIARTIGFRLASNDCGLLVTPPPTTAVGPKETRLVTFSAVGLSNSFYYQGDQCPVRIDVAATPKQKSALKALGPEQLNMTQLAGDPVRAVRT